MNKELKKMAETMELVIRQAAELIKARTLAGEQRKKGKFDYVTAVDVKVQEFIQERLKESYPQVDFLGEEQSEYHLDREQLWILDPIDGTTNFIHDYRSSAISLAYAKKGEIVIGMIYQPYADEMFYAVQKEGAYCNGIPIHVSETDAIEESLIAVGTSPYYKEMAEENFDLFQKLFLQCMDIRRSGSAAIDLAWVSCGRCEAYLERKLKIWDYAAGMLILKEAGGNITDYKGENPGLLLERDILATNGKIKLEKYL